MLTVQTDVTYLSIGDLKREYQDISIVISELTLNHFKSDDPRDWRLKSVIIFRKGKETKVLKSRF